MWVLLVVCKGPSVHKARESSDIRCKERRYAVGGYGYTSPENVLVFIAKTEGTLKARCWGMMYSSWVHGPSAERCYLEASCVKLKPGYDSRRARLGRVLKS